MHVGHANGRSKITQSNCLKHVTTLQAIVTRFFLALNRFD